MSPVSVPRSPCLVLPVKGSGGPGPVLVMLCQAGKEVISAGAPEIKFLFSFTIPSPESTVSSQLPKKTRLQTRASAQAGDMKRYGGICNIFERVIICLYPNVVLNVVSNHTESEG